MNIIKFFRDEWNHWINSRLEQKKFEVEAELGQYRKLDDGSPRIRDMIDDLEKQLTSLRMRIAIRSEAGHRE